VDSLKLWHKASKADVVMRSPDIAIAVLVDKAYAIASKLMTMK
jgi:hypothetical protein